MNICIATTTDLSKNSYGGVVRVLKIIENLKKQKDVEVFVLTAKNKNGVNEKFDSFKYLSHRVLGFSDFLNDVVVIDELNPFRIYALKKIITEYDIDIVQNEHIYGSLNSLVAMHNSGIPLVVDTHNFEYKLNIDIGRQALLSKYTEYLEKKSLNACNHILTVSNVDMLNISSHYNLNENKFSIIENGVDTKECCKMSQHRINELKSKFGISDKYVFVFHGRLDYLPNTEACSIIVNYISPLIKKYIPNSYFLIIGMNPPDIEYDSTHIKFTGMVPNLYEYLSLADVAVVPINSGSGTRLKVLEYMACEIPIVATFKAVEGIDLVDGMHALLSTSVGDDFINNMIKLHSDAHLSKKLQTNARHLVNNYEWDKISKKIVECYENLIR